MALLQVPTTQYPTIQAAIDAAGPGDTITVHPGTYTEALTVPPGRDNLLVKGRGATLQPPSTPGNGVGFLLLSAGVGIHGFRIRNFDCAGIAGFIGLHDLAHLKIRNCGIGIANVLSAGSRIRCVCIRRCAVGVLDALAATPHIEKADLRRNVVALADLLTLGAEADGLRMECNRHGILSLLTLGNLLRRSEIRKTRYDGVYMALAAYASLAGNRICESGGDGLTVAVSKGVVVEWNRIKCSRGDGLRVVCTNSTAARFNKIRRSCGFDIDEIAGKDNVFDANRCRTSSPDGLCTLCA